MSNILSEVHPELVAEWSDKNLPLTPYKITYGSNKVVWWKGACGHEWKTSVMMTGTVCFLMKGKAASAYRVSPTRFCAGISAMRCFRQIRRWKWRYSERTLTGAFPAVLPLSSVATGKSIVRNAPVSHTKGSRQSTQGKSAQNRK